ncbi:hypothetical protein H696_02064 [Fonticula alba]|uniref:Uncharacterized protein n=1 Tax=Fonticula alba TaxID=691883 RepID=A0A058ZB16_FONAL|nr:hypothetical protein H696_02064 [Fonticula alba]KCV71113.1 hypothetical protein H696_02064 [Fonticula alba]|eukprot:XP_009494236.1 hypothetical protein H696_02064 [Fonticula alba]
MSSLFRASNFRRSAIPTILGSSKRFRWLSLAIDRHGDLDEGMRARVVDFVRDPSLGTPSPSSSSSSSVCSSDPGEGLDAGDALLRTADVHFRSGDGSRWPNVLLARFA